MSELDTLKEWVTHYIKSRDVIKREIVDISDKGDSLLVKYKDRERTFLIIPQISDLSLKNNITIVVFNTLENFNWLLKSWKELVTFDDVNIYFINPESITDKRWIIFPHIHDKVSDSESLKLGLEALFNSVETYHARH